MPRYNSLLGRSSRELADERQPSILNETVIQRQTARTEEAFVSDSQLIQPDALVADSTVMRPQIEPEVSGNISTNQTAATFEDTQVNQTPKREGSNWTKFRRGVSNTISWLWHKEQHLELMPDAPGSDMD
jgi:hypothetical protein